MVPVQLQLLLLVALSVVASANVTYDRRGLLINGMRKLVISGSIHYPRSTPEMWPDLIQKSKDGGLNMIETYVFWNLHETSPGEYNFNGRNDLVKFVKLVADAGLYVHLRIGPYACAEWNYGGFPVWLHLVPGIKFRTDNEPFKAAMKSFTATIVDMMKQEKLYASQGGPIILSQIENEYGNIETAYGDAGKRYLKWAAAMARSLDTGVPWVMCQQGDAPDPIINTCNGFYCDGFTPNSVQKPKFWTENWTGWFSLFGGSRPYRPVEDIAFAVARFFQGGGTLQNYYMYHGGTNFGRTSGGPFIATTYDYDAPLDEFGRIRQPKWGHLKDLHAAIKLCEEALVSTEPQTRSLGPNLEVSVYEPGSGKCTAFLANTGNHTDANVRYNGNSYQLPAWSVSILPDCKNVAFNTAKINSAAVISRFARQDSESSQPFSEWSWRDESIGPSMNYSFAKKGLLEQIRTTVDTSDYLWYSLHVKIDGNEPFLEGELQTFLQIKSLGHALRAFVNGKLVGSVSGSGNNPNISAHIPVQFVPGTNKLDLLSLTVGLQNYGAFFDEVGAGISGPVKLVSKSNDSALDLSSKEWSYQVGLGGEGLGLSTGRESSLWNPSSTMPTGQPLVWYRAKFHSSPGSNSDPLAIDLTGMSKGEAWVNGESIGRYWPAYIAPSSGCTSTCDYKGRYNSEKCHTNCGNPSQKLYHVPRSFLRPTENVLVMFEELGGDPTRISFATSHSQSLCSHVSDCHPPPVKLWSSDQMPGTGPVVSLECPLPGQSISSVEFASFGNPLGSCGAGFVHGRCRSVASASVVEKACIGFASCMVPLSSELFGDPCPGEQKTLAVEAICA